MGLSCFADRYQDSDDRFRRQPHIHSVERELVVDTLDRYVQHRLAIADAAQDVLLCSSLQVGVHTLLFDQAFAFVWMCHSG